MKIDKSVELFERAKKSIPGGVNSPVRAFKSVGGDPLFIEKGGGSKIYDVDGNEFIDYVGSWGPLIFGHNTDFINEAVTKALEKGSSFGAPTEVEIEAAELIRDLVPSIELVRMVNSGTEATMSAIRIARGYTGKDKVVKFEGCYHGHGDPFLIKAGSGAMTFGTPTSPGVTEGSAKDTLVADFNNIDSVKKLIDENKNQIAAVIIEPIAGNMGVIESKEDFLNELRELCSKEKIVLIFDEVMTGFRVARGGAQEIYGVKPDLTTFGKVIGGGFPVGAFGGKADIMNQVSPDGPIYQAGTLSGNPVAMSAGAAALKRIKDNPEMYSELEQMAYYLERGLRKNLEDLNKNYAMNRVGSMMCQFFVEEEVKDFAVASKSDTKLYGKYFQAMLKRGVYLAPAQFEAMFVSTAHGKKDLDKTINAHKEAIEEILE